MHKARIVAGAGLLIVPLFMQLARAQDQTIPEMLKPPIGQVLSYSAHGEGVQIYQCSSAKDEPARFSWILKAPEATLRDESGKTLGKHYAGPTWEAVDGSKVVGEPIAKFDSPDHASIPWLLLRAKSIAGRGAFSNVTSIQRLRTRGGNAPAAGCDPSHAGKEVRMPYSALYRFYTSQR